MTKASSNGIQIEYEAFGDPSSPPMLLVMGLGGQMIAWDEAFCRQLAEKGLYVIRFDNRDVGLSTKIDEAGAPDVMDAIGKIFQGEPVSPPYNIEDMADDAAGLLDALKIDKAHVCGMSMGGMIAQEMTLRYPSRVLTLTSIYSSTGNPRLPQAKPEILRLLLAPPPKEREAFIEHDVGIFRAISGNGFAFDEEWVHKLSARAYDRSFYPEGVGRQLVAILTQRNRKPALASVTAPTLVIHGTDDPLVSIEAGKDTAEAIPGAELMIIEGMGHDLPHGGAWDRIGEAIAAHTRRAEAG